MISNGVGSILNLLNEFNKFSIEFTRILNDIFYHIPPGYYDIDLWPSDPKINKEHLLSMANV